MALAPIALFVYNRLDHTKKTVNALKSNLLANKSDLVVFSDAAKSDSQLKEVLNVRAFLNQINGFKSVTIIERSVNFGLADSIIDGVTNLCKDFGKVIVLEDDLVTSPYFLQFMNEALDFYENEEKVVAIDGYMYPIKDSLPETFFLKDPGCWGWATWHRGWNYFEPNGSKLLSQLKTKKLEKVFNYDDSYPYTKMLIDQVKNKNNSWAIRWYASIFLQEKLVLHVGKSLVQNIGNDSSGTHKGKTDFYNVELNTQQIKIDKIELQENALARESIATFLYSTKESLLKLACSRIDRIFRVCFK